eukprot:126816_1
MQLYYALYTRASMTYKFVAVNASIRHTHQHNGGQNYTSNKEFQRVLPLCHITFDSRFGRFIIETGSKRTCQQCLTCQKNNDTKSIEVHDERVVSACYGLLSFAAALNLEC